MFIKILATVLLVVALWTSNLISASADGGWVLWLKSERLSFNKDEMPTASKEWEILGAVPAFDQCLKIQAETWGRRKTFWNDPEKKGVKKVDGRRPDLLFITLGNSKDDGVSTSITETLMCLPSPLDPRDRK